MKYKLSIGILILLVCITMLMSNSLGSAGPPVWINQATLSIIDSNPSQDPENSGFGPIQVVVWEEHNGNDWDIWMKWSFNDGAPGSWAFPPIQPATTAQNERHPAVAVTDFNPITFFMEVHVVYELDNGNNWDVCHTWTNNFGAAWTPTAVLDAVPNEDALDPAVVYTGDLSNPTGQTSMLVQFVWSEYNTAGAIWEIRYDAYYFDWTLVPPRGYVSAGLLPIPGPPIVQSSVGFDCRYPEIASIDEISNAAAQDYYFAIVWEEDSWLTPPGRSHWNIFYRSGTTQTTGPGGMSVTFTAAPAQINPVNNIGDSYHPDISATQDYQNPELHYFHVNYVFEIWGPPVTYQIDTVYSLGAGPTPPAASFAVILTARGPTSIILDNPTIASKVINLNPTIFETWMAWEDDQTPPGLNPDIYYRVGNTGGGVFAFTVPWARVPYIPVGGNEFNPELWNRNDAGRMFPPFTHLVFDSTMAGGPTEIEYIDP